MNPPEKKKIKCWEYFKCGEKDCPAYKSKSLKCWLVSGTHCHHQIQGKFLEKMEMCLECPVFKENMDLGAMEETFSLIRKQFLEYKEKREKSEKELKEINEKLARGIKEVSNVLTKVAQGDFSSYCQLIGEPNFDALVLGVNMMISDLKEREERFLEIQEKREKELERLKRLTEERAITLIREKALREDTQRKAERLEKRTKELEEARTALMNILEDVEEARSLAEEEKNKTLSIIQNFADGLMVFDIEKRVSLVNPKAEEFFEIEGKDILGKPFSEFSNFPSLQPLFSLLGAEIKEVFRKELALKEGLILEVSTLPIMRKKKRVGTLIIFHDITREKMIERMKTEFVSIAAHQLRTPLSAIKWTLRMLLDGDLGEMTESQKNFLQKTYQSNERMINLINDLLNVTRIEEGRYLYKPVFVQLEEIVQSVINSLKKEIEKKKIKFEFKKPRKKLPQVKVDVEKIKLAIDNLIENAIRYTPAEGKVTVSLKGGKKEIEFEVKDTGIGIPKDQQKRIFTKFFRAANAIRMETEGSGLGLYITKNIIEAHGGKIWFESEEGRGTTFYFTLPLKREIEYVLKEF